jgi:hypothetical protein
MKEENEIKKELRGISPLLADQLPHKEGFGLPDDYFAKLQTNLQKRLAETPAGPLAVPQQAKVRKLGGRISWAVAASIALLLAAGTFWSLSNKSVQQSPSAINQLTANEVLAQLDEHIGDYDLQTALEAGIINYADFGYQDISELDDEEISLYIDGVLGESEGVAEEADIFM